MWPYKPYSKYGQETYGFLQRERSGCLWVPVRMHGRSENSRYMRRREVMAVSGCLSECMGT